ncbi:MAG: thiosulfate oxidation carrier complex protein SoxZ, partial [Geminicoccaceae bacterium]|nr:thiosulfate oxidation carrier complex protein SoxZ [Geminicoccaceae bacterium]
AQGNPIPRRIINRFTCTYNGKPVCDMVLHPAISANPYISFFVKVEESGTLQMSWFDDDGSVYKAESKIEVTG